MRETMVDVFNDGIGSLDFSRLPNGSGMSARSVASFQNSGLIVIVELMLPV